MQSNIQLVNISEEISRLWNTEQGQKKIRASLFTLIFYVQKNDREGVYQSLIKSVVSKFPCRVIFVLSDTNPAAEYLRTQVSSETIGVGETQVFCEIIQIEVAGKLMERVPFMILPHMLPDLPVYLLWTQDPSTESAVLPHLEPYANRIIFDSGACHSLQGYCQSVLSLMQRFHCAIGDLHWSALSGWRSTFTQVFNLPDSLLSLVQSSVIRIQYNKTQGHFEENPEIEAAYFQGWLASRLGWKFQGIEIDEGNIRLTYRRTMQDVLILLVPQENENQSPGTILAIDIESNKNKGHYSFKKHPQSRQVFIQYSDKDFCQLPYSSTLSGAPAGQEIIEEIFYPTGGEHYRAMLEILSIIPWRR